MSLDKFKAGSSDQLSTLKRKLYTVDRHIRRSENLPATLFMQPELLQYMNREVVVAETINEIKLGEPKSVLFTEKNSIKYYFISRSLAPERRFVLKIQPSKVQIEVLVELDREKKVAYLVKSTKGILINELGWKKAEFTLIARKKQKLSMVKIEIDTIIVEHKVKVHGVPSQRKTVEKDLKQYLKNNLTKEKIQAIIEKRRTRSLTSAGNLTRSKTLSANSATKFVQGQEISRIFRSTNGFNESTSVFENKSPVYKEARIQSTQIKRDLNCFEDSKQKYLHHIKKMEPQKALQIIQYKKKYNKLKRQTLEAVSSSTLAIIFAQQMIKLCIKVHKNKIKEMHTSLLCKKFYKNLVYANKMRMGFRNRNKTSMDLNLSMISSCLWSESRKKAQARLMSRFKIELFLLDTQKIAIHSQQYLKSVIIVQRKFRLDDGFYRMRFQVIIKRIKGYTFENDQEVDILFRKYKKFCYTKSKKLKFGFTKYHTHIDQLMKQKIHQKQKF